MKYQTQDSFVIILILITAFLLVGVKSKSEYINILSLSMGMMIFVEGVINFIMKFILWQKNLTLQQMTEEKLKMVSIIYNLIVTILFLLIQNSGGGEVVEGFYPFFLIYWYQLWREVFKQQALRIKQIIAFSLIILIITAILTEQLGKGFQLQKIVVGVFILFIIIYSVLTSIDKGNFGKQSLGDTKIIENNLPIYNDHKINDSVFHPIIEKDIDMLNKSSKSRSYQRIESQVKTSRDLMLDQLVDFHDPLIVFDSDAKFCFTNSRREVIPNICIPENIEKFLHLSTSEKMESGPLSNACIDYIKEDNINNSRELNIQENQQNRNQEYNDFENCQFTKVVIKDIKFLKEDRGYKIVEIIKLFRNSLNQDEIPYNRPSSMTNEIRDSRLKSGIFFDDGQNKTGMIGLVNGQINAQVFWQGAQYKFILILSKIVRIDDPNERLKSFLISSPSKSNKSIQQDEKYYFIIKIQRIWRDLVQTNIDLQLNDKMKQFFSLTHQLRTPLNCSLSMIQQCFKGIKAKKEKPDLLITRYLEPTQNSLKLMLNYVNDMLDFVQMSDNKIRFTYISFDLKQLMQECSNLFEVQAKHKGIQIVVKYSRVLPTQIVSDSNRIRQIILNLLSNSMKFTLKGMITLAAELDKDGEVESENFIQLSVIDTGVGIEEKNISKIFQAFNQVDNNDLLNAQGCGLGLLLSNQIASGLMKEGVKNCINVVSEVNKGSTFSFKIFDRDKNGINSKIQMEAEFDEICENMEAFPSQQLPSLATQSLAIQQPVQLINIRFASQQYLSMIRVNDKPYLNNTDEIQEKQKDQFVNQSKSLLIEKQVEPDFYKITTQNQAQSFQRNISLTNVIDSPCDQNQPSRMLSSGSCESFNLIIENTIKNRKTQVCDCASVLIVDDNELNIMALGFILDNLNVRYEKAFNGLQAYEIIQRRYNDCSKCVVYRIILMDMEMPVMNGLNASTKIKEFYQQNNLETRSNIYLCSAHNSTQSDQSMLQIHGISGVISKPIDEDQLKELLFEQ